VSLTTTPDPKALSLAATPNPRALDVATRSCHENVITK